MTKSKQTDRQRLAPKQIVQMIGKGDVEKRRTHQNLLLQNPRKILQLEQQQNQKQQQQHHQHQLR